MKECEVCGTTIEEGEGHPYDATFMCGDCFDLETKFDDLMDQVAPTTAEEE